MIIIQWHHRDWCTDISRLYLPRHLSRYTSWPQPPPTAVPHRPSRSAVMRSSRRRPPGALSRHISTRVDFGVGVYTQDPQFYYPWALARFRFSGELSASPEGHVWLRGLLVDIFFHIYRLAGCNRLWQSVTLLTGFSSCRALIASVAGEATPVARFL